MTTGFRTELTRRELLAGFLGLPLAAGCGSPSPPPPFSGEIVGADVSLGHALRDGRYRNATPDRWESVAVLIVGGGVAGLSTAWGLSRAGCEDYRLLELEGVAGGTSRSGSGQAGRFPWGAHYLPVPQRDNTELLDLLKEMELVTGTDLRGHPEIDELALCRDPQERVFYQGEWHEDLWFPAGLTADDERQFADFQRAVDHWSAWRDARQRRAFCIPLEQSSDDPELVALDQLSMEEWLTRQKLTSPRVRWLVDYACRDDYGLTLGQTSAWAGLFYFVSRVAEPGIPAQPLLTWPEGNGRLVSHLVTRTRDHLETGWGVCTIRFAPEANQPERSGPIEVIAVDSQGNLRGIRARKVVFAAPQFLAPHVIDGYEAARGELAREFAYGSWLVANLTLRDRPAEPGFPLSWDNVLYDSPALGYVVNTHQLGIDRGPVVLTWYYPCCDPDPRAARARLERLDWNACAELALSDLEQAHPEIRSLVERIEVMRWGHAMIQPRPGFLWGPARRTCSQPYRDVHFAHSDNSGLALFEEAFHQGLRAAREVSDHLRELAAATS